ncbi:penicillin-insensitive murein endopeptidase [Bartonella sp. HY038]|uniref:penicillin-insensitive murein endopeptidase n=1 Tax=Bartonella sp. HY038 TaxID=2759660 RepID=UPI00352FE832
MRLNKKGGSMKKSFKFCLALCSLSLFGLFYAGSAQADQPAKQAFSAQKTPTGGEPKAIGFYSKGCLSGAMQMPIDGPNWQVMRLSRNRNWGHPTTIAFLQQLSRDAAKDGWRGLLIGDISQPRGGPMPQGHASHQIGMDADIWLMPMPARKLSAKERENMQGVSMLKGKSLYVDPKKWTPAHGFLIRDAASSPLVDRIFVHPGIKKQLCETATGDRAWLGKVRPYWGHIWHFHVRLKCQPGSPACVSQPPVPKGDGCGSALAWWFTDEPWVPKTPKKPTEEEEQPKEMMVSDLPKACAALLNE